MSNGDLVIPSREVQTIAKELRDAPQPIVRAALEILIMKHGVGLVQDLAKAIVLAAHAAEKDL